MAAAAFPLYIKFVCAGHLQTATQHLLNVFCFFLSSDFAFNCSPVYNGERPARQEMSLGRWPTVIPSFLIATLCLSPNFSPSGSGCVVTFSPILPDPSRPCRHDSGIRISC